MPEFKADGGFEPETYMQYFEDSNPTPNAAIGCKMPFLDGHESALAKQLLSKIAIVDGPEAAGTVKYHGFAHGGTLGNGDI